MFHIEKNIQIPASFEETEWSGNIALRSLPGIGQLGLSRDGPFRQSRESLVCRSLHPSLVFPRHWGQGPTTVLSNSNKNEIKSSEPICLPRCVGGWRGYRVNPGLNTWVTWLAPVNIGIWNGYLKSSSPSGSLPYLTELDNSLQIPFARRFHEIPIQLRF